MNKIGLFVAIVIAGVVSAILISNQGQKKAPEDALSLQITPTIENQEATSSSTIPPVASTSPTVSVVLGEQEKKATKAMISTSKGDIELELYPDVAAKTVENFFTKAKSGFYNNLTFHRVEDWVIQGGDPLGNGTGDGNMPVEFNSKPFVIGSVGVASRGDGKVQNDAQFFITKKDASWLNGQYTNFGIVTKGMDVVNNIAIGDKILIITTE